MIMREIRKYNPSTAFFMVLLLIATSLAIGFSQPEPRASGTPAFAVPGVLCDLGNTSYSKSFAVLDAVGSVTYSVTSGSIPPGLSLNASTGLIFGTSPAAGTTIYQFTLSATDSASPPETVSRDYQMRFDSTECGTAAVAMVQSRSITSATQRFNLENRITLPGTWTAGQQIAVGLSFTASDGDAADAFRGSGGCVVDVSASTSTDVFNTTQSGRQTLTGGAADVWIVNDQTPEASIYGPANAVREALRRVQVRCSSIDDMAEKYLRLGVVPSESPQTIDSSTANGGLFYVFSTRRYIRYFKAPSGVATVARVEELWNHAKSNANNFPITVNGRIKNVASGDRRRGWVATLTTQDEILLANAIGVQGNAPMIGLTDQGGAQGSNTTTYSYQGQATAKAWAYDTAAWGTPSGGVPANCETSEERYRWLGPDSWCAVVPAPGMNVATNNDGRYWLLSNGDWVAGTSTNFTIDLRSTNATDPTVSPFNGRGVYHQWHMNASNQIDEPNASGDYFYMGYQGEQWDDAGPADWFERPGGANSSGTRNYLFVEYCSPATDATRCDPADDAVAATQFVVEDTSARQNWVLNGSSGRTAPEVGDSSINCTNASFTESASGAYRILTFTNNGGASGTCSWTPPSGVITGEVLLVGGGGAGGAVEGGGGGAGGVLIHSSLNLSGPITITVGSRGAAATHTGTGTTGNWDARRGGSGGNTTLATPVESLTAAGGAGGNGCYNPGTSCGTTAQGGTGGSGGTSTGGTINLTGGAGGNGCFVNSVSLPGNGGNGHRAQTRGTNGIFGGGGGGSCAGGTVGSGGQGGGASGSTGSAATAATANSGGGGAGGAASGVNNGRGSAGAGGIVVVKFALPLASNSTSSTIRLTYTGTNSITTTGTVIRQSSDFDGSSCSATWVNDSVSATTLPTTQDVSRSKCLRWTFDPGLLATNGASRPQDSGGFQPTSNLTSPVLIVPAAQLVTLPAAVKVDPRATWADIPGLPVSGTTQSLICLYEGTRGLISGIGQITTSSVYRFDIEAIGTTETTSRGATITNDRTTSISISGTTDQVQRALGTLRVEKTSGRFASTETVLIRAVPIITGFTSGCNSTGSDLNADASGVFILNILPYNLEFIDQIDIDLRRDD